ncbi:HDOD domain-containing protein [Neptuniibacter sp.]|uniref:HDOD domain-containing protein n=1 Tax=Neptuniibacter sp. TaxID=1962643 RepID=UPI002632AD91|nr:HDOD domain-containing protein [Neptuniibacter sp.]MCP4596608.1 HDOD domain-containing protein [Neptuniibacter sp.]
MFLDSLTVSATEILGLTSDYFSFERPFNHIFNYIIKCTAYKEIQLYQKRKLWEGIQMETALSLKDINDEVAQLPLLPGVLFELMKLDPEDTVFYDRMLQLAKIDPPLATFIIAYSNSAISSPNSKIDSLQSALTRVGSRTIMELLTALSVSKVFVPQKKEHKEIWRHSIEVAHIASYLARLSPDEASNPDTAYLAGLLHDIGRFVLFQLSPEVLNEIDEKGWGSPDELIAVELETIGFDHSKVGYLACKKLEIPQLIANVVRYHHKVAVISHPKAPQDLQSLSLYIQVADAVSMMLANNEDWPSWTEDNLLEHILSFCIHPSWKAKGVAISSLVPALPILIEKSTKLSKSLGA